VTAFLITPDMPGFKVVVPALEKVGMRGTKTANLEFSNLQIPEDHILGKIGAGLRVCLTVLDYGRTTFGAACTGAAKALVERGIEHARTRYQFKRPLASFGLVKKKIASIAALAYAMEASTYLTAGFIDKKVEEFMLEAAILKVFASEALWSILFDTMQIFGGRSFFTDQPFERMMRDARLNTIGEGSNEVLRAFIGVVGMRDVGVQLKSVADVLRDPFSAVDKLWDFGKTSLKRLKVPEVPLRSALFKKEAFELGRAIRRFGLDVIRVLGTYRENILEHQLILERIANAVISLYTMTAVLSKIDADLERLSPDMLANDIAKAKCYCQMALENIDANLSSLYLNSDHKLEDLSDQLTGVQEQWQK
jgi:alkylation response protein AidB-like acyl-CoA dehydrogenase